MMVQITSFQKQMLYLVFGIIVSLIVNFMLIPFIFNKYFKQKEEESNSVGILSSKNKVAVPITKGICSLDKGRVVIDTYDSSNELYVELPRSTNQLGGAQFSYSFWLRRGLGTEETLKNKIIFYRGSEVSNDAKNLSKGYIYDRGSGDISGTPPTYTGDINNHNHPNTTTRFQPEESENLSGDDLRKERLKNRVIKCPLIRFGESKNSLRIEFNSLRNPHLFVDLDADVFQMIKSSKKNPHYNLITFAIQDNFDFGGIEKGIKVDVFIDDALVKTQSFENNALRINEGPIVLFASNRDIDDARIIDADIVDLTYYNYALQTAEIEKIYNNGFKERVCELPDSWNSNKNNANYRKINLYNETRQI